MKRDGKNMEDILASLEGLQRATPPDSVFGKILMRTASEKVVKIVSMPAVSVVAASILLLITVNIAVLNNSHKKEVNSADPMQEIVNYYGLTSNAFGL